jgi:hypothetical protein
LADWHRTQACHALIRRRVKNARTVLGAFIRAGGARCPGIITTGEIDVFAWTQAERAQTRGESQRLILSAPI